MALICVPLVGKTASEDVRIANKLDCDLVEVRLDFLRNIDGLNSLSKIKKPIIATCMPEWEGGFYRGSEEERLSLLESCIPYSKYITLEFKVPEPARTALISKARRNKVKSIVAYHNFKETPRLEGIKRILHEIEDSGADIAKVAFMANEKRDVLTLLCSLAEANLKVPVIALSMGEKGKVSRILAPFFGSYLTYASSGKGRESAPGQMTLKEMKTILNHLK